MDWASLEREALVGFVWSNAEPAEVKNEAWNFRRREPVKRRSHLVYTK